MLSYSCPARPASLLAALAAAALLGGGCADRRQVLDCWVLPEPERAAARAAGRCGDAFARYYKPLPQLVADMAAGLGDQLGSLVPAGTDGQGDGD